MSDNYLKLVTLVLIFPILIYSMTITVTDSIIYDSDSSYIMLSNNLIIESTLRITLNDSPIEPGNIFPIEGKLFLNDVPKNSLLIVEYEYLKDNIPHAIGPKWKTFPILDSLTLYEKNRELFKINTLLISLPIQC